MPSLVAAGVWPATTRNLFGDAESKDGQRRDRLFDQLLQPNAVVNSLVAKLLSDESQVLLQAPSMGFPAVSGRGVLFRLILPSFRLATSRVCRFVICWTTVGARKRAASHLR